MKSRNTERKFPVSMSQELAYKDIIVGKIEDPGLALHPCRRLDSHLVHPEYKINLQSIRDPEGTDMYSATINCRENKIFQLGKVGKHRHKSKD
jgi:hypothetical protein